MKSNNGFSVPNNGAWRFLRRGAVPQSESAGGEISPENLALINRLAPTGLQAEDVYVRSMYLCSDKICPTDWGRFTENALRQICSLVVGRAVLRGHDRSSLPLARFFRAEIVRRADDVNVETGQPSCWVRAWFYWLRGTTGARDLLLNIDGGVYREVSISWRYRSASCSICGEDIRVCDHTAGRTYDGVRCHFVVDEVLDVLEGSLVYRGAESHALLAGVRGASSHRADGGGPDHVPHFDPGSLLACLSQVPRSSRRALVAGAGDPVSIRILKALGLWVHVTEEAGAQDEWLADRWDPSDPQEIDLCLVQTVLGDNPGSREGGFRAVPLEEAGARYLILRVWVERGEENAAERCARRMAQRLGYLPRSSLGDGKHEVTVFAQRSES
jgi:hypothetical protein